MSIGLIALLDDVAAIAKVAAASLDDVATQAAKAGAKAAGVVIDDAAVTPRYVVGFAANRELPIVRRIAVGSLKNKLLILLPAALALAYLAPWAITPLLMLGGAYLCYEGAEKIFEKFFPHAAHAHEATIGLSAEDAAQLEERRVRSAISTDFILSAEIMAIALASITSDSFAMRAAILAAVGIFITVAVYGAVALIVKADDAGIVLARSRAGVLRVLGRTLVLGMPVFLKALGIVGTAAMVWVGGGIFIHGLEEFGIAWPAHAAHALADLAAGAPVMSGLLGWFAGALAAGVFGLVLGALCIPVAHYLIGPVARGIGGALKRG